MQKKAVIAIALALAAALIAAGAYIAFSRQAPPIPGGGGGAGGGCSGPGGTCSIGYVCIQECGPPVVSDIDPAPGWYCERKDIAAKPRPCPICLASATKISTPNGQVRVSEIRVGMTVWSLDAQWRKTPSAIKKISRTKAPSSHKVVHLLLSDGRETWVSPSHPTADGRPVGVLIKGDAYDGATVSSAELEAYGEGFTYDILPDSQTGQYWADGILLGSSLH